jgi:hypothetical protein
MEITDLPFNKFIGICRAENPEYALQLPDSPQYLNHMGNVHAVAQISLAEASSGEYLLQLFKSSSAHYIPVVRRMETKFRRPAQGMIFSRIKCDAQVLEKFTSELDAKGRALISVGVDIEDANKVVTMHALVDWYVQRLDSSL